MKAGLRFQPKWYRSQKTVCFFAEPYPPRFEVTPKHEYNAEIGKVIRLKCKVEGNPPPIVSWIKDDKPVELSTRVRNLNSNYTIKIKEARLDDQGNYTCIAANTLGKINASMELHIHQGRLENTKQRKLLKRPFRWLSTHRKLNLLYQKTFT